MDFCGKFLVMKTADAMAHFGGAAKLAKSLGITNAAVYLWKGIVPKGRAYELHTLSKGELPVVLGDYEGKPSTDDPGASGDGV